MYELIVLTLTNERSGEIESLTVPKAMVPSAVRDFAARHCLPVTEIDASMLEAA